MGITEVVVQGETGYLCEVGDIECMAKDAIEILSNPERAKEMGEKGRDRALTVFDRSAIVDQYESLYEEMLAHRNSGVC